MPSAAKKPSTRIQEKNRAAILQAGLTEFSAHGFRGATLDQIAATAGLSKPNMLYYFKSKDAIHTALLDDLLEVWLEPLRALDATGEPIEEILGYMQRKLALSRDYPRESRLFANEILQGAPRILTILKTDLRRLVDAKAQIIAGWIAEGRLAQVDPHHLIFSVWALTQHYADFDVQVRAVKPGFDPITGAETYLTHMFRRSLEP